MSITRTFANGVTAGASSGTIASSSFDSTGFTHVVVGSKNETTSVTHTPSDNKGSTGWTSLTRQANVGAGSWGQLHYVKIGTPGSGHIVTITFGSAVDFRSIVVWMVNATTGAVALANATGSLAQCTANGSSTTPTAGNLTSDAASVSFCFVAESTALTYTQGTGWTEDFDSNTYGESRADASATGPFSATATGSVSMDWACCAVSLKEAGSAAAAPLSPTRTGMLSASGARAILLRPAFQLPVSASGATFSDTVAESVAFADAQTAQADFSVARAESIAFTDAQTGQVDFSVTRAESIAFTDSQTGAADFSVQRDESVAFTDAQTAGTSFGNVQRDESISFTDSQTGETVGLVNDSIAFTDAQSGIVTFSTQRDESITFADAQTAQVDFSVTRAESIAFTDSQTGAALFAVQRDEAVAFTDSQDATVTAAGTNQTDESISFTDSQSAQTDFGVVVAESISFFDAQTGAKAGEAETIGNYGTVGFGPIVRRVWAQVAPSAMAMRPYSEPAVRENAGEPVEPEKPKEPTVEDENAVLRARVAALEAELAVIKATRLVRSAELVRTSIGRKATTGD